MRREKDEVPENCAENREKKIKKQDLSVISELLVVLRNRRKVQMPL